MSESIIRRIAYCRVSTADQNLDMQIQAMVRYGVHPDLIFTDKMSGATSKRPGLISALQLALIPETEFVVWKLDRLGRTVLGIIETLQLLERRGVRLYSLTERMDLSTPFGKAMVGFLAVFAELERNLIRERTMAGLKRARERGDPHGRPIVMTAERIEMATQMLADGKHIEHDILPALQGIKGPRITRSPLYAWTKLQKRLLVPANSMEDR
jgi:DNA invertase Pin-like site-specific DNA recombinase